MVMFGIHSGGTGFKVRGVLLNKCSGTGNKPRVRSVLLDRCGGTGPRMQWGRCLCTVPANGVWRWHLLRAWLLNVRRRKRSLAFGNYTWPIITGYRHTYTAHSLYFDT